LGPVSTLSVVASDFAAISASGFNAYRVFDNRADANHRYTTDRSVRDAMVAKGWIAEGDGPDAVVMCAPS
jgi:hypothetical protein